MTVPSCRRWFACLALTVLLAGCAAPTRVVPAAGTFELVHPEFLEQYAVTRRFRSGEPAAITVTPDGRAVLFLRSEARSNEQDLYELDLRTGAERRLLTASSLLRGAAEALTPEERARRERMRQSARGITSFDLSDDGARVLVPLSGRLSVIDRADGRVRELPDDPGAPIDPHFSPDGRRVACARDGELYVYDLDGGAGRRLTSDASDTVTNAVSEFVAQEEMGRLRGFWWSPDGRAIAYQQTDVGALETMFIADAMHPDRAPQSWRYPRPGHANAIVRLGVVGAEGGPTTWIDWDARRYPYLATVTWDEHGPLALLVQNREQTEEVLLRADPESGATTPLHVERDDAWLNLDQSVPHWLADGSFLWTTERNGAWQIEHRGRDGTLVRVLTDVELGLRRIVHVDETHRLVYVAASADPIESHLYAVSLDGVAPARRITEAPGLHDATFSEQDDVYVHASTLRAGGRTTRVVRRASDGSAIASVESRAETPRITPRVEYTTAAGMHAAIVRPSDFRPGRRYPVLVSVYAGPHSQTVQGAPARSLLQQWFADQGCIVVSIDGRGTPSRGRAWERAIRGNLIDVALDDQVEALLALGRRYAELDLERVGVYGWSFGGYFSAMAVMRRPDVYHAGIAGAPVCDWLDYDTHYTERYLGLPDANPEGYRRSNVLTYAADLERPLLIMHGTADDNVYFAHSLKMSNALFRAGRPHEFLALSDFTHMVSDPVVVRALHERMVRFFRETIGVGVRE